MKTIKTLFAFFALTLLVFSCSSDDDNNTGDGNIANEQNLSEETPISLSVLNSDISIDGATKNAGTPPASNSDLDFNLNSTSLEAVQNAGFNLKFSTNEDDVAGAYILFKDLEDNTTSSYFDVPVSRFQTGKSSNTKTNKSSIKKPFSKSTSAKIDGEYEIDIDFGDSFPAGKFCGDLCIYDSQNNISQIVTVCVEVEAWGGNASIVGEWIFEPVMDDDYLEQIDCEDGQSIEVPYDDVIKEELLFTVKDDGTYEVKNKEEYKELDRFATRASCSAIYSDDITKSDDKQTGKWAFNETSKTLTLVSFKAEDFITPENNEEYPNGNLVFEGDKVEIINGKLVITETYTEEGETFTDLFTFRRK